jgi:hypothetical protein
VRNTSATAWLYAVGFTFALEGRNIIVSYSDGLIFLGGTVGSNAWRETIVIPGLLARGIPFDRLFNPVVEHWTPEARQREDEVKRAAWCMLYVIASPDPLNGTANVSAYSLVELVMSLYDAPDRTIALFDMTNMAPHTSKAVQKSVSDLQARFPTAPIFTEYRVMMDWIAWNFNFLGY